MDKNEPVSLQSVTSAYANLTWELSKVGAEGPAKRDCGVFIPVGKADGQGWRITINAEPLFPAPKTDQTR